MTKSQLQTGFFILLLAAVVLLVFSIVAPYLGALALAILLGIIFHPAYRFFVRVFRFEWLAAIVTVVIVAVLVLTPLSILAYKIFQQATNLYVNLTSQNGGSVANVLVDWVNRTADRLNLPDTLRFDFGQYARQILAWFVDNLGAFFSGITQIALTIVLGLLSLFYFLKDGKRLREFLLDILPMNRDYSDKIIDKMHRAVNSIVVGTLLVATIQGVVAGIGLAIFGVPNAAFWGCIAAITALIPNVGTALVTVPSIIYLFFSSSSANFIGMIIWAGLAVGLIDNMLAPQVLRYGSKMHPLLILLGVLGGIGVFGPIGFVLGPLSFALLYALLDVYPDIISSRE